MLGYICGNHGILPGKTSGNHTQARHQHNPGQGIKPDPADFFCRHLGGEVLVVLFLVTSESGLHRRPDLLFVQACHLKPQGIILGPDHMIRGEYPIDEKFFRLRSGQGGQDRRILPDRKLHGAAAARFLEKTQSSPQDGQNQRGLRQPLINNRVWRCANVVLGEIRFGPADIIDHPIVGGFRLLAKGEDAMIF